MRIRAVELIRSWSDERLGTRRVMMMDSCGYGFHASNLATVEECSAV